MSLNLIKKWFIKRNLLSDKDNIGVTKSTALDLDAYIQHRIDESVNGIADGEQITWTDGTLTNTVNTNNPGNYLSTISSSSSTNHAIKSIFYPNTSNVNGVQSSSVYIMSGTDGGHFNKASFKQLTTSGTINLTESSATPFLTLNAHQNNGSIGGIIVYTIFATDGTHMQSKSGRLLYDAILKDSSGIMTITDTQNTTCASSGTLTATLSAAYNSPYFEFRCSAVSSLTQTSLYIKYHLIGN